MAIELGFLFAERQKGSIPTLRRLLVNMSRRLLSPLLPDLIFNMISFAHVLTGDSALSGKEPKDAEVIMFKNGKMRGALAAAIKV